MGYKTTEIKNRKKEKEKAHIAKTLWIHPALHPQTSAG
jgi:hypothetical protein